MKTLAKQTKRLLDLLPVGTGMRDKYDTDTNQYKFWTAIAMYYVLLEEDYDELIAELGISTTEDLISRWEREFGIPDEVIGIADTLEERRQNILLKKGGLNLLNIDDFRDLATTLGYDIDISTSSEIAFPPYDVPFFPISGLGRHFLVVIRADLSVTNIDYLVQFYELLLPINVGLLIVDTSI